jgi:hypothetical protein
MGTMTPIHDALAEALHELQRDLDLARELPVGRSVDDPADHAVDDPADHAVDDPADHAEDVSANDQVEDDPANDQADDQAADDQAADDQADDDQADDQADDGQADDEADADADADDEADADAEDPDDAPLVPTVAADAEEVVALAWQEADERDHARFGTGHLLLGLVRAEGPEAGLLAAAGVTILSAGAAMSLIEASSGSEPVEPCGDHDPVADTAVAEVLEAAAEGGQVTAAGLLTALLARPSGQAAEMLAALGVEPGQLATAATEIAVRPIVTPRPVPRDPSGLLSAAWCGHSAENAETTEMVQPVEA